MAFKLSEIIMGLEFQNDQSESYLERATGRVVPISQEDIAAAEDEDDLEDYPDWQRESIEIARKILDDDDDSYIQLPTKWDIHEYDIMERFIETVEDQAACDALYRAIKGKGAFRYFKDTVCDLGIRDQWFGYRNNALKEIAIEWCRENQIEFEDDCVK
jgi:hypothetical protein